MTVNGRNFHYIAEEPIKTDHRYEVRSKVEVVNFLNDRVVTVRHDDGKTRHYRIGHFDWIDLGPVLKSGIYLDVFGRFWRWNGERWARTGAPDLTPTGDAPAGSLTRLVPAESVNV